MIEGKLSRNLLIKNKNGRGGKWIPADTDIQVINSQFNGYVYLINIPDVGKISVDWFVVANAPKPLPPQPGEKCGLFATMLNFLSRGGK